MNGIQKTTDYNKFSLIQGNREIIAGHVAKLATSILQRNMLPQNPILVNEKYEVIDGQHRLEVARNNNLEIYYMIVPGAAFEEIVALNSSNRVWNSMDYVNGYASKGSKDFMWLKEFIDQYGISVTQALTFLFGSEGGWPRTAVRRGDLNLTEEQKKIAESRAEVLWGIRPFIKRSGFVPRAFLLELLHLHDEGLGEKLIKGVRAKGSSFMPEASRKDAYAQLRLLLAKE